MPAEIRHAARRGVRRRRRPVCRRLRAVPPRRPPLPRPAARRRGPRGRGRPPDRGRPRAVLGTVTFVPDGGPLGEIAGAGRGRVPHARRRSRRARTRHRHRADASHRSTPAAGRESGASSARACRPCAPRTAIYERGRLPGLRRDGTPGATDRRRPSRFEGARPTLAPQARHVPRPSRGGPSRRTRHAAAPYRPVTDASPRTSAHDLDRLEDPDRRRSRTGAHRRRASTGATCQVHLVDQPAARYWWIAARTAGDGRRPPAAARACSSADSIPW